MKIKSDFFVLGSVLLVAILAVPTNFDFGIEHLPGGLDGDVVLIVLIYAFFIYLIVTSRRIFMDPTKGRYKISNGFLVNKLDFVPVLFPRPGIVSRMKISQIVGVDYGLFDYPSLRKSPSKHAAFRFEDIDGKSLILKSWVYGNKKLANLVLKLCLDHPNIKISEQAMSVIENQTGIRLEDRVYFKKACLRSQGGTDSAASTRRNKPKNPDRKVVG